MCDCEQIQGLQPEFEVSTFIKYKESGNWYFDGEEVFCVGDVNLSDGINDEFTSDRQPRVWLPRQDQLQEMAICDYTIENIKNDQDASYIEYYTGKEKGAEATSVFGGTTEQRLLRMIMEVNYNKTWDGKWL